MKPDKIVKKTLDGMKKVGVLEDAVQMRKYMKNKFDFLGVKSPARKELQKELRVYWRGWNIDEMFDYAEGLWLLPFRELQYVAIDALTTKAKRMNPSHLGRIEALIVDKSWWDTVDALAPNIAGSIFSRDDVVRHEWVGRWNKDENMWLNRSALLHQLRYKDDVDLKLLFFLVDFQTGSKEFFINKASGWALRQASKFYPTEVKDFVESRQELSNLTIREATKYL